MYLTLKKYISVNALLAAVALAAIFLSLTNGSDNVSFFDAFSNDAKAHSIIFSARLPRVILAALVGLSLASSGATFQAILKNPLADPFILGVSGGAALGSVAAIGLKLPFVWVSLLAFAGAVISMLFIFAISGKKARFESASLLLTGVIFNAFCFALILFINAVVSMEEAYQIIFLLIGNLETTDMVTVAVVAIFILTGFVILCFNARKMNLLSLGDNEARALGVNASRVRIVVFFAASLMVGAAVAASGLIGFVGLFVPHVTRLIFGADNRLLVPASGFLGAAFLVLADWAARTVLMNTGFGTILPVGVITALVGAPMFFVILKKR